MATETFTNFAQTNLSSGITAGATSITVADGSKFPTSNFSIIIDPNNALAEVCTVSSRSGNTLYLSARGQDSTTAAAHIAGASVLHTILARHLTELYNGQQIFLPGRPQGTQVAEYLFDDGTTQSFTAVGVGTAPTLSNVANKLRVAGGSSDSFAISPYGNIADGEIYFEWTAQSANGIVAIPFRQTNASNGYVLYIRPTSQNGQVELYKVVSTTYTKISDAGADLFGIGPIGSSLQILVRFVGTSISLYVNDVLTLTTTDTTFSTGSVGVGVGASATADFDNFGIYSLPSSWVPTNYWKRNGNPSSNTGSYTKWDPDAPPANASVYNDEFDGSSLASWSWVNQGSASVTLNNGVAKLYLPAGSGDNVRTYEQTAPSGDWTLSSKITAVDYICGASQYYTSGLSIRNSSTGKIIHFGPGGDSNNPYWHVTKFTNNTTFNTTASYAPHDYIGIISLYYRIRRVSSTLYFEYSTDGFSWRQVFTEAESTFIGSIDRIGIGGDAYGTSYSHSIDFEFFRLDTTHTSSTDPCYGRKISVNNGIGPVQQATGSLSYVRAQRTSGNFVTSNVGTTWTVIDSSLDLTLSAKVGDIIEVGLSLETSNEAVGVGLDMATVVNGTVVNYFGTGSGGNGILGWQLPSGQYATAGGAFQRTLTTSDISNGTVTLRLMYTAAGARTILATATNPMTVWAKNVSSIKIDGLSTTTGPVQVYVPDASPIYPSAYDDEFNDGSLDTTKWTKVDPGSTIGSVVVGDNGLEWTQTASGSGSYNWAGVLRAVPSGNYSVIAKINSPVYHDGTYTADFGIALTSVSNSLSSTFVVHQLRRTAGSNNDTMLVPNFSSYTTYGGSVYLTKDPIGYFQSSYYMRVRVNGTTVNVETSTDGKSWLTAGSYTVPFTPVSMGIVSSTQGSLSGKFNCAFFRVTTDTSATAPVLGRKIALNGGSNTNGAGFTGTGVTNINSKIRTSGNYSLNSTSWVDLDTSLDLTLVGKVGDTIEATLSSWVSGTNASYVCLDVATIVGGVAKNYFSNSTTSTSLYGVQAWLGSTAYDYAVSGSAYYTLQQADISNGVVQLRLRYRTSAAVVKTLASSTDQPLQFIVKNLSSLGVTGSVTNNNNGLLAVQKYITATDTYYSTTSTTFLDVDSTNLKISFVVPPSGQVLVVLSAGSRSSGDGYYGLGDNGTTVASQLASGSGEYGTIAKFVMSGLTPNTVKTYTWRWRTSSGTFYIYTGSPNYGSAIMEVWAIP